MFRNCVLFAAMLCLAFGLSLPVAAANQYYAYEPHYLSSVEEASNQVKFFSPHFAPMEVLQKWGGTTAGLTSGYSLASVDVNQLGLNLSFSKSGVNQKTQYFWSWGGGYVAPVSTPYKDDIVTSMVFADIKYFELRNFGFQKGMPASWCVAPQGAGLGPKNWVCVVSQKDAEGLIDALATLVVASGGNIETSPGIYMRGKSGKELQKHPEEACKVSWVLTNGPSEKAGIQIGDVLQSFNSKPCTSEEDFRDSLRKGNGEVHIEALRKGRPIAIDLHYVKPDAGVDQLRQKSSAAARHPVGSTISIPAAAPVAPASGFHLGARVRIVTDADVAALALPKPKGVVVTGVDKGGLAEEMQMQVDDVIVEVNGSEIGDVDSLTQLVRSGAARNIRVCRKGQMVDLVVPQSL